MLLKLDRTLAQNYKSTSQQLRVMSETWLLQNAYCVKCGNVLTKTPNNTKVEDFYCSNCSEQFELKTGKYIGKQITDGAYYTMIEKIQDNSIPNFFFLNYSLEDYHIPNLMVIPKHYLTQDLIIKRKPLSENAKRAGWIGCNINISNIPESGKLYIIKNGTVVQKNKILTDFNKMLFLRKESEYSRGWLIDIIKCIESLNKKSLSLEEIYSFENYLKEKHPLNNNIRPKIRQQLQLLRDKGYIRFIGKGQYEIL